MGFHPGETRDYGIGIGCPRRMAGAVGMGQHKSNKQLAGRIALLPVPGKSCLKWVISGGGWILWPAPGSSGTAVPAGMMWWFLCVGMQTADAGGMGFCWGLGSWRRGCLTACTGSGAAAYFREPDPGQCILDEYAGFPVAAAFVPVPAWCAAHGAWGAFVFVAGIYVLFRLTDTA